MLKSQDFDYLYEDNSKPNAVTRTGDNIYHYEALGNVTDIDPVLHNSRYCTKYLFNGKELDTETGLAYYGARYYSPELSVWYGVDPLMEKYPQNGAYVFCNANPVKFVDVDGEAGSLWTFVSDDSQASINADVIGAEVKETVFETKNGV